MHDMSGRPSISPSFSPPAYEHPVIVPSDVSESLPSLCLVGSTSTSPLVYPSSVVAHLRILGAFHVLEHSVTAPQEKSEYNNLTGVARWHVFIHRAVWRFEIWLQHIIKPHGVSGGGLKDVEIPPLDVLLVWHAYLLNPRVYAEDTMRVHQELAAIGGLPLDKIATQINPDTFIFEPTSKQVSLWESATFIPHKPLSISPPSNDKLAVKCPRCEGALVQVPWLCEPHLTSSGHAEGKGWCQNQFSASCGSCGFIITRESMAVGRFAADIATAMRDKNMVFPGTLFDPRDCLLSPDIAQRITALLLQPFVDLPPTQRAIGEHLSWRFTGIEASLTEARDTLMGAVRAMSPRRKDEKPAKTGIPTCAESEELASRILKAQKSVGFRVSTMWRSFGPRIAKMLASYRDNPTPFSTDLVGAVIRQTSFTSKAFELGWFDSSNHSSLIVRSVTRYHKFLHILERSGQFLVPTLDIDLSWHTHQLRGDIYMADTKRCVGMYVDHDDRVEEGILSNGFDETSRLWESTFHTPYSSCEPLHQGGTAVTFSKIRKLARRISSSNDDVLDSATYPSEHPNTVVLRDKVLSEQRVKRGRNISKRRSLEMNDIPFVRSVEQVSATGAVTFDALGLDGWGLLGNVDRSVLDAKTLGKGQCSAGYGMPYFGGPMYFGNGSSTSGSCAAGGCAAGPCAAGGCGGGECGGGGRGHAGGSTGGGFPATSASWGVWGTS